MHLQVNTRSRVERRANATKSAAVGERLETFYVKSALRQFSVSRNPHLRKHVPAETPARASRVGAAPGIGMSSKKAAARRRRAAEPERVAEELTGLAEVEGELLGHGR